MGNFLENFLADTVGPESTVAQTLDYVVPDSNTALGTGLTYYLAVPSMLLRGGVQAATMLDDYISRPVSFSIQAVTTSNPLYRDGVDMSDFVAMWEASSYISPGRAAMTKIFSPGSGILNTEADPRFQQKWNEFAYFPGNDYNPYTQGQQVTEQQWDNSPLGTIGSLSGDLAFQLAAGKGIGMAAGMLKRGAGLATNVSGFRDLQKLNTTLDEHLSWVESGGVSGRRSVLGDTMMDIANSKNYADIYANPWLNNFSRSGDMRQMQLAEILTRVEDPYLVKDLLLASRGDTMAVGRLFQAAPDTVWSLSDMSTVLRSKFVEGGQYYPTESEANLIRQTFDSAIDRDEFWSAVKNNFMQTGDDAAGAGPLTNISVNADFVPMQGVAGRAQRWLYNSEMNTRLGSSGTWVDNLLGPLGNSAPTTVLLQWVGGRRPIGRVSLSGLRPTEAVDEMLSYSASARALRGAREVSMPFHRADGSIAYQTVTMDVWRNAAMQRLAQASLNGGDTAVAAAVRELEGELIEAVVRKYSIDPERATAIRTGVQEARDRSQQQVARDGFFIDENGTRVVTDPVTRRQLADELALVPLDELDYALRLESTTTFAKRGRGVARTVNFIEPAADWILKFWRTNMLFKPGYTPKNSIGEPAISSLLAHGSILSPDGLMPALNNFFVNRGRQLRQAGYAIIDRTGLSSLSRNSEDILDLHSRRMTLQKELDEETLFLESLDSGATSPAMRAAYERVAQDSRRRLRDDLDEVEALLDDVDPVWREVVEVPSYAELSRRIDDLDGVINGGSDWLSRTQARVDELNSQAASRTTSVVENLDSRLANLRSRLDEVESERLDRERLMETGRTETTRRGEATQDDWLAATQRELDELRSKREELRGRRAETSDEDAIMRIDAQIESVQGRIRTLARRRASLNRGKPKDGSVTVEGGAADMTPPKDSPRGRDYGGTASARQVESLRKQIDELEAKKAQYLDTDSDYVPVFLSNAEMNEIDRLSRLIDLRERVDAGEVDLASDVERLKNARAALRDEINVLEPTALERRTSLEKQIAALDGQIASKSRKVASQRAKREAARQRRLGGEKDWVATVGDDRIEARGVYNEGQFGAAVRAEASSGRTNTLTYDPGEYGAAATARWARTGGVGVVQPSDPLYWEELAYIANRQIRGDQLAVQVLQGKTVPEIVEWLNTPQGRKYARGMGWDDSSTRSKITGSRSTTLNDVNDSVPGAQRVEREARMPLVEESDVARNVRLINQYFPTPESRALLLDEADVTASDLQRLLGDDPDALSPVHSGALTWSNQGRLRRAVNNALGAIWRNMAVKPEDRFGRFPYLDRQFRENVQRDARLLQEQGIDVDAKLLNNLRANAITRALKDSENTFYNIRRYSNPVYALRYIVGFPGAYFNSLYRYARLAYRNPGRAYLLANAYETMYESFGVNSEGEKVEDWKDATGLVFSVPEAVQKVVPLDDQIRLSTQTVDYISSQPTFLPIVTVPVATLLKYKPQANKWIKEEFGDQFYETLFPFGEPTFGNKVTIGGVVADPLFAGWELDLLTALSPSDEDFIQAADQLFAHRLAEWEKGGQQGPPPTPEEAASDSSRFWFGRAALKFAGIGGIAAQPEGDMMRQEWYNIRQMYPNNKEQARKVFLQQHGEWADYYTRSSSKYRVYVPATVKAVDRLQENENLANELRAINPDDPWLAGMLFWGTEGEFDRAVYNYLADATLPGDTQPIRSKYTPQEMADYDAAQRSWDAYNAAKAKLDATMTKYGYTSLRSEGESAWLYQQWDQWLTEFKQAPSNSQWLDQFSSPDTSQATKALNAMRLVVTDSAFMQKNGQYGAYQATQFYLEQLDRAQRAYNLAESPDARESILTQWDRYVSSYILPTSAEFAAVYTRALQGKDLT